MKIMQNEWLLALLSIMSARPDYTIVVNTILLFSELETTQVFKTKNQVQIITGIVVAG